MGESLDKAKERIKHLKDREILELILAEIYNVKEGEKILSNQIEIIQAEIDNLIENTGPEEDDNDYYYETNSEPKININEIKEELKKDTQRQIKKEGEKYEQERKRKEFREKHGSDIVAVRQK